MRIISFLYSKIPKNYHFSNFPERYIRKQTEFVEWRTPSYPNYQPRVVRYRKRAFYDIHRPWTGEFEEQNAVQMKHPTIYVEPIKKFYMFVGDAVLILRGKDKGKRGVVSYVVEERNWVCVKGLNLSYNLQQRGRNFHGFLDVSESPLLVPRDVALIDPEDGEPTEIEWRFDEEGDEVRVSLRTSRIIPIPVRSLETRDFKQPRVYAEQPKDTPAAEVAKTTFKPLLKTFEMDIADEMGIKDDRVPYPMYWY